MAEESDQEKSEEATQARREDYRKRGQVAQTKELASALFILAGVGAIYAFSKFFFREISDLFTHSLGMDMVEAGRESDVLAALRFAGIKMATLIAPVAAIGLIISVSSSLLQIGWLQVEDALSPDVNRINPMEGFKKIFAMKTIIEALKSNCKIELYDHRCVLHV